MKWWCYLDMDSFFASCEQQEEPFLRGKPLGITAMEGDKGCLVAASYEAKAFGVKTTMSIRDARELCPDILLRPSRHRLYVRYNKRIAEETDKVAELEHIRSVDEFQFNFGRCSLDDALHAAQRLKNTIRDDVGSELGSSAGIGSNHLLAKIAGKLEKPDGLQWIDGETAPKKLSHLRLEDLPGIALGTLAKLSHAGISTIPQLCALDPAHARLIWGSIEGERFVRAMQGEPITLQKTKRNGYGNSKILAPEFRYPKEAYLVGKWLLEKATMRMRRDGYCAKELQVSWRFYEPRGGSSKTLTMIASQDTKTFMAAYRKLSREIVMSARPRLVSSISVHLGSIIPLAARTGELLNPMEPGRRTPQEELSASIDLINRRFGKSLISHGFNQKHPGFFERG